MSYLLGKVAATIGDIAARDRRGWWCSRRPRHRRPTRWPRSTPSGVLNGNPVNSGFLVFVEHDVTLRNDESEGTMAMGGNLRIQQSYHIAAHAPQDSTFTDEGDSSRPSCSSAAGSAGTTTTPRYGS